MPRRFVLAHFLLLIGFLVISDFGSALAAEDAKPVFRAGAATSNITPPLGELIVGGWKPTPAAYIHDQLHARCLVLDDGKTKLAIVVCDNLHIPRVVLDQAKKYVEQETGIPASHQLIASTHTHSATTALGPFYLLDHPEPTDYQKFLARRIADGIRCAINQLEPAQIAWGTVDEPTEVFNRRWYVKNTTLLSNPFGGIDQVRMNPPKGSDALDHPAGPTDPQISFISVQSKDGRPISLLANYSLHYVGGVGPEEVSADYFGYFAKFITEKLNAKETTPAFVGILSNGTSGDINNINFSEKGGKSYARYEKMQEVAQNVADRVADAHADLKFRSDITLDAIATDLTLAVRKPTPEIMENYALVRQREKAGEPPVFVHEVTYANRIDKILASPDSVNVPLQALRIGDLAISASPFETFVEIGLELKGSTPFPSTFTIELANGSYGYLPTPEQHRLGGYETWLGTNVVEYEASTKLTKTLLDLQQTLKDRQ
ncbi:neutral/alkaline non-lysosomal ceramidase N-terminal domain-containing protein [Blastopirellula sp. JC732]|uniref:Neutral/alkaline non-lysosomal ceramidase N-terminal domain-containing protein n=1 Tax=Blastopirellula sediminis TaxID=2894196 RepID=A0A9X1MR79_9BACT|nr:neutral/alkaline non-lysosomal ceramidase N-terminal domain-containing protein [Blastopirellula sediminis]MCC9605454.1 neutral/alkaline non-lysosomal ceramidase N-terminal domain-containing protein [Blastopirellula sediminis]MCC9631246.1 neutral/alkaline non-lysosomal ceramidase N-terminal domain-containing protein [Blastopirellula sediminis]